MGRRHRLERTPQNRALPNGLGLTPEQHILSYKPEVVKEFKQGTLTLGVDDLGNKVAAALTGATVDGNGVLISSSEDGGMPVAVGFRAAKANGTYRYFWLYRVKFAVPATSLATKGDSITFSTPTIEGTILRRNKPDATGNHPWKAEVSESEAGFGAVVAAWYEAVYEPTYTGAPQSAPITKGEGK